MSEEAALLSGLLDLKKMYSDLHKAQDAIADQLKLIRATISARERELYHRMELKPSSSEGKYVRLRGDLYRVWSHCSDTVLTELVQMPVGEQAG